MKKRLCTLLLIVGMIMSTLAGCVQSSEQTSAPASKPRNESSAASGSATAAPTAEPTAGLVAIESGTNILEAENHIKTDGTEAYIKDAGEAVKYMYEKENSYTSYAVKITESGTYAFTAIGTGMVGTGYNAIAGSLYVNDELKRKVDLTTNEKYNPWDNPLESVLGTITLEAGTYTIKFVAEGGTYIMDKMIVATSKTEAPEPSESDNDNLVQAQRQQVKETMENAVNTVVQFKEIEEFNPDKKGYEHIKAITYDGLEYKGEKTKVFAYVGFPEGASADSKVPAIVLVHGGAGHPYLEWVRRWNERGYAAIAMETTGYFPNNKNDGVDESHNSRFTYGLHGIFEEEGYVSAPTGTSYPANKKELEEQWPYHALAQIILAHNVLRQDARVDTDNIGITGVSWGGVMVSQVIGYDTRFSFAIPVFGSAYLGNEVRPFDNFQSTYTDALWAAERNLDNATMPILWYTWNDDYFFSIPGTVRSYLHTEGFNDGNTLLMLGDWDHGHQQVWKKEHSYLFADWVTYGTGGFATFDTQPEGRNISCKIDIPEDVTGDISALLYYITAPMSYSKNDKFGNGATYRRLDQIWQTDAECLTVDCETGVVSGVIPDEARGYYIQLTYSIENSKYESSSTFVSVE